MLPCVARGTFQGSADYLAVQEQNYVKETIVLVSNDYKPSTGGVAEWTYQVACALVWAGWHVVVVAPEEDDSARRFDSDQVFETLRIIPPPQKGLSGRARFVHELCSFRRVLWGLVTKRKASYILLAETNVFAGYWGYLRWLALSAAPVARGVVFHGQDVELVPSLSWLRRALVKSIVAKSDDVFSNSRFTADRVRCVFGKALDPVVVGCGVHQSRLPPAVNREAARRVLGIKARHVVLTVARLVPRKGIDMVIQALPTILRRFPDMLYIVAGGGQDLPRLKRLARQTASSECVRFEGVFADDLLAHYYCAADIFVMPSRYIPNESVEGFGIVYAEAGHYGLPVIGGNAGGVPEVIVDGETGLLVDPNDPHGIASAVTLLLGDPVLRRRLGAAGEKRVHNEFTWDAVVKGIGDRVNSTLVQRRGCRPDPRVNLRAPWSRSLRL